MPDRSVAVDAFEAALDVVQGLSLDGDRPPPLGYRLPGPNRTGPNAGARPLPVLDAPAGGGPLVDAVLAQRAGEVSSTELVERCLEVIAELDETLQGMVEVQPERALAEAAAADADRVRGRWRGPLHGIPLSVKDVIDVAGYSTRAGSDAYDRRAAADAGSVTRLRDAGAVVIGKASTHEFALGVTTPQSRNPFDHERIPGGSSGGSAISVATGMALGSLGTDTRASIRVPAALSGVVGLKATHGAVPIDGIVSLSWTMDHVAPMAATVADAALMLGVLMDGLSPPGPGNGAGMRIGVADATLEGVDRGIVELVERIVDALVAGGMTRHAVGLPTSADLDLASAAGLVVSRCEAASAHRSLGLERLLYWEEVADQLDAADAVTAVDYLDAQRARGLLGERLLGCFESVDVLLMPTAPTVAPLTDDYTRHLMTLARNAIPWSFVGFPAMSVPIGWVDGLPAGMQVVAPPHREDLLLAAGLAVEKAVS